MIAFHASEPKPPQYTLLKPGDYNFRVLSAEEKMSQAGNEMIELKLDVFEKGYNQENQSIVYDNLVFTEKAAWKIDSFLKSTERHPGQDCDCNLIAEEMTGWAGRCRIRHEKDQNGNLRNKVDAYLWEESDGIPF
jgi:hypothetical protein